jgi:hypothetical protein
MLYGLEGGLSCYQHIKKSSIEEPKASCCSLHLLQSSTFVKEYSAEKIGRDGGIAILELKVNLKPSALVWMNFHCAFCLMLFL